MSEATFAELGVDPQISAGLSAAGITSPFPIQKLAIPLGISGTDLIGQARTGTGKTLAFGVSLLHRLLHLHDGTLPHDAPRALVIAPTRELAIQVTRDIEVAGSQIAARTLTIYGGTGYDEQLKALKKGVDVVVGTPGRLLDLAQRGALKLDQVDVLVLDEADEMLDLGFLPDIQKLIAQLPSPRQTMLFSATMPAPILALARANLNRPVNIRAEGQDAQATVPDITQYVYQAHDLDKPEMVARILQSSEADKIIVFSRTKRSAQRLTDELQDRGFQVVALHGDLNQGAREKALKRFRSGKATALVATDVAARGIDISGVSHVINYECPDTDATYVHRIGRTGRAGNKGVAVTLVDWQDVTRWKVIDKALDLGLGDPVETYSSSPHLYADLAIPEGTRGRIKKPKPVEDPEAAEQPKRQRPTRRRKAEVVETKAEEGTTVRRRRRRRRPAGDASAARSRPQTGQDK